MNYYVSRDGQQYGPYSLADLQRYLAQGNIQPTDLARSEALEQWLPVQQIVGNIAVQQTPPPVNYGQVPLYSQGSGSTAAQPGAASTGPIPPGLHWGIVLLLSVVTCYVFGAIWLFVEATYAHKLRTNSKPLLFYGLGIPLVFVAGFMSAIPDLKDFSVLVQLAGGVLMIAGHFSLKNALEEYYNHVEPINLQLSGGMTFFFNVIYFQYHLSKIREWKRTGVLESGVGSYRDAQPQRGIIYTPSEVEAMKNRPPQG